MVVLLVTLHGGKPEKDPHKNNVHAYDKSGKMISHHVLEDTEGVLLDELRGIHHFGKYLYVVNANQKQNGLLCYEGADTSYRFVGKFVSRESCKGILHPFDFAFDGAGHCYVSSQDTNVVTRLKVSADGKIGTPALVAPALPANGKFLPGTFVASCVGSLSEPSTTAVPPPMGLEYSAEGAKKHSVRGVVWANNALYVVDQPAGRVKVYDSNGKFLRQSNQVKSPVHLVVHESSLYVSGGNEVLTAKLSKAAGDFMLAPIPSLQIKNGGGMAFTGSGHFYIASRTENFIQKFDDNFEPMKFECTLPDNPEFLLHI
jgi:DNA-binding beta-propeller fold protein YncE